MAICPIIAAYVKVLDARMPPPMRKELYKYARLFEHSDVNAGVRRLRAYVAVDWAIRDAVASAMELRGHPSTDLIYMDEIADADTAFQGAQLAMKVAAHDEAVYAAWSASIAAQLVMQSDQLALAADAAAYAFYLAAAATNGREVQTAWDGSLACLEAMLEVG